MKKVKIRKGYVGVISDEIGQVKYVKDANKALLIEAPDSFIVTEKSKSKLTDAEKLKLK